MGATFSFIAATNGNIIIKATGTSYSGDIAERSISPSRIKEIALSKTDNFVHVKLDDGSEYDIDPVNDTVTIGGTTITPGSYTAANLKAQFDGSTVFRKANTSSGGTGTATTDASQLTTGTLPDARLSTNVAKNLTPTPIKTGAYTAAANDFVKTDATGGNVPITLPTAPADKTRVGVKMIAVSGSNTTTISSGGTDVLNKAGGSTVLTLTLLNQAVILQYESANGIWDVVSDDLSLSQLDGRYATNTLVNSRLQVETQDYLTRIIATGGYIDALTIDALDRFAAKGKRDGWWSKVVDFAPMLGSNLTTALVKMKYPNGVSSTLVNNNLVAADYVPTKGFVLNTNTNKFLQTGIIPTSIGLSATNIAFGAVLLDNRSTLSSGHLIGDNPASGDVTLFIDGNSGGQNGASMGLATYDKRNVLFNYNGTAWQSYQYGTLTNDSTSFSTANNPATEITLFKSTRFATVYNQTGSIASFIICSALAKTEALSLNQAMQELYTSLGRLPNVGSVALFEGDSITSGQGSTANSANRFAGIVSRQTGAIEYNIALPSRQLRQNSGNFVGAYLHYTDLNSFYLNNVFILLGTNDCNVADAQANGDATIIADFGTKLETIIQNYKDLGRRVIVGSLPYNTTSNATKITAYVVRTATAAKNKAIQFIDLYNAILDTGSAASYMSDANHPNDAGHAILAEYFLYAWKGQLVRKPTLDFPSIAANSQADLTVTVYNAVAGMSVNATPMGALEAGLVPFAFVSANDTVIIRLTNTTGTAIDPASMQWKVTVFTNY